MTEQIQGPTVADLPVLERLHAENARHLETLLQQVQDVQQVYLRHQAHHEVLERSITALRKEAENNAALTLVPSNGDAEMDSSVRAMRQMLEPDEDREQLAATMRQKLQRNVQE